MSISINLHTLFAQTVTLDLADVANTPYRVRLASKGDRLKNAFWFIATCVPRRTSTLTERRYRLINDIAHLNDALDTNRDNVTKRLS